MNSVHHEITQQLIKRIEAGNTKPWSCPWVKTQEPVIPINATNGRPYQGVNIFLLWGASIEKYFGFNRWVTYRQAQALGGQVRKGERGFKCLYFNSRHEAYAAEELVAELCACFWCAKCGITDTREDHASYLTYWLKALKSDAKFFFKAAKAADHAMQYIETQALNIT